jgi:hypothetical protein
MDVTVDHVVDIAPEFAEYAETDDGEATIETYIEIAMEFVCASKWGSEAKAIKAVSLLTAHFLKDLGVGSAAGVSSSAAGPITMERVGDLQRSYGSSAVTSGPMAEQLLSKTKYGRTYLALRRTIVITPMVT